MAPNISIDDRNVSFFELRDLGLIVGLTVLGLVAWVCPERYWSVVTRSVAACVCPILRVFGKGQADLMRAILKSDANRAEAERTEEANFAGRLEEQLQYLREYRPGGWRPRLRTTGIEHLERALGDGAGCILWIDPLLYSPLVVKKALHDAGYPAVHLSRYYHGPSNSEFGRQFINVIVTHCEDRYLKDRLRMKPGTELAQVRLMSRLLRENGLVSIACSHHGSRIRNLPILGGTLPCASGAPALAIEMDTPLLPVAVGKTPDGGFEVSIDAALPAERSQGPRAAVDRLLGVYAERLESAVRVNPAAFAGWRYMRVSAA
ncbi:MAG: hypothetical protein ACN4GT_08930 [Gammaproteobacteria bacterium]